jgi:hypothetical protein
LTRFRHTASTTTAAQYENRCTAHLLITVVPVRQFSVVAGQEAEVVAAVAAAAGH